MTLLQTSPILINVQHIGLGERRNLTSVTWLKNWISNKLSHLINQRSPWALIILKRWDRNYRILSLIRLMIWITNSRLWWLIPKTRLPRLKMCITIHTLLSFFRYILYTIYTIIRLIHKMIFKSNGIFQFLIIITSIYFIDSFKHIGDGYINSPTILSYYIFSLLETNVIIMINFLSLIKIDELQSRTIWFIWILIYNLHDIINHLILLGIVTILLSLEIFSLILWVICVEPYSYLSFIVDHCLLFIDLKSANFII